MSDLKFTEFRERAERGVDLPDLDLIERRGRALHTQRVAAAVGGLALAVVAGFGIAGSLGGNPETSPAPANPAPSTPSSTPSTADTRVEGVRTVADDNGEALLLPGRSTATYDGVEVGFDVPGDRWEWWGAGAGLQLDDPLDYATTVFWLPEPSARLGSCDASRAQALGSDPDDLVGNVAPLRELVSSTVLQQPRVVEAFGGRAAYLQLRVGTGCAPDGGLPAQLRGVANGERVDPGWEGPHVVDVWHVVPREGEAVLVVAWHLGGSRADAAERRALIDSIRVEAR